VFTVGGSARFAVRRFGLSAVNWLVAPTEPSVAVLVQVRAHGRALACRVLVGQDGAVVELAQPIGGLAAGQLAVIYRGDQVLGAGTIELL